VAFLKRTLIQDALIRSIESFVLKIPLFWSVFIVCLLVRILYHFFGIDDFWGDSYHNVYISWLTANSDWVYSDYSGREVVWLPFYRYLSGLPMFLLNSYTLGVGHVLNSILSSISCGVVAVLVASKSSKRFGQYAGITLGLLPWYLAYSHMNMPEILASLVLILMVYAWQVQKYLWLAPIALIGVLTRNEVTLVMMIFGVILLCQSNWKAAVYLASGSILGLVIWGVWCHNITGEFFWWISERIGGSTWVNTFQRSKGDEVGGWYYPILSIFIAFPFIMVMIIKLKSVYKLLVNSKDPNWLPSALLCLLITHWVFIFSLQYEVIGYPDPKYYVVTLPIAIIFFFIWLHQNTTSLRMLSAIIAFTSVFLLAHIMPFKYMHFSELSSYKISDYLKETPPGEGNIWMDFTVSWYHSEISPTRIYSSKQLVPKSNKSKDDFVSEVQQNILSNDIRYVMAAPASFSQVLSLFPEMKLHEDFTWGKLRFQFLYEFVPDEAMDKMNWIQRSAVDNSRASFWKVTPVGQ